MFNVLAGTASTIIQDILAALGNIITSVFNLVTNLFTSAIGMFWSAEAGVTVLGWLVIAGMGFSLVFFGIRFIVRFIKLK